MAFEADSDSGEDQVGLLQPYPLLTPHILTTFIIGEDTSCCGVHLGLCRHCCDYLHSTAIRRKVCGVASSGQGRKRADTAGTPRPYQDESGNARRSGRPSGRC